MPTPNEIEEAMANNYEDFLLKQDDPHLLGQLWVLASSDPLEDFEIKLLVKMIQERDFTGKGNIAFDDLRKTI